MTGDPTFLGPSRTNTGGLGLPKVSDRPDLKPEDIVIAVIGITGSGKTTFINHFSEKELMVGHGLDSCTQIVQVVPCNLEGRKIYLVDTPGFDYSFRTDAEILLEIATWLNTAYRMSVKLTGIIYLHPILNVRFGGAGIRNIPAFKKLCGNDGLASVVLATTMWNLVADENIGNMRESRLKTEDALWKTMIEQGSQVFRQDKRRTSALRIVQYLIDKKRPVTLDIQREIFDKECGLTFRHKEFSDIKQNFLIVISSLGHGSLGIVEEVQISKQYPSFVRKRVQIPYHNRSQRLKIIKQEACVLESLVHRHVVRIIGSYSECPPSGRQFYSLLMSPVGDQDLKTFLEVVGDPSWDGRRDMARIERSWLHKWFMCLASTLAYIHSSGVRHQDIKPSNIIHRGSTIYFTDFSSSSQFQIGQTTSTENPARTSAMYSAPEVINCDGVLNRHGRGTDVFALGAVFCEMLTVLNDRSVEDFHRFLLHSDSSEGTKNSGPGAQAAKGILLYGQKIDRVSEWFGMNDFYHDCLWPMLAPDREKRPDADAVVKLIRTYELPFCPCNSKTA